MENFIANNDTIINQVDILPHSELNNQDYYNNLPPLPNNSANYDIYENNINTIPITEVKEKPTEIQYITNLAMVSFGVMLVCIVVILIGVILYKKHITKQKEEVIPTPEPQETTIQMPTPVKKKKKQSKLSTPSTIPKCIRSFLENTKSN